MDKRVAGAMAKRSVKIADRRTERSAKRSKVASCDACVQPPVYKIDSLVRTPFAKAVMVGGGRDGGATRGSGAVRRRLGGSWPPGGAGETVQAQNETVWAKKMGPQRP